MSLPRRIVAEGLGTAFLLAVVIGSGIMGERLAGGISRWRYSQQSGDRRRPGRAHLDLWPRLWGAFQPGDPGSGDPGCPAVARGLALYRCPGAGAFAGVAAAHLMFGEPLFASLKVRTSGAQWWSEFVATFGLLMVIWGCVRQQITAVPYAGRLYHLRLLVYRLHLVRQSRRDHRARRQQHLCGDSS